MIAWRTRTTEDCCLGGYLAKIVEENGIVLASLSERGRVLLGNHSFESKQLAREAIEKAIVRHLSETLASVVA